MTLLSLWHCQGSCQFRRGDDGLVDPPDVEDHTLCRDAKLLYAQQQRALW